jgi:hemolysin activation/secretion protein
MAKVQNMSALYGAPLALLLICFHGLPAGAAQAAAPTELFEVAEYRVLGNSMLEPREIEQVLYPLLGPGKTIADVEAARTQLEALYRDRGYGTIFVDIPEQKIDDGLVRLRVTEGKLDRVRVTGTRYYSNRQILASAPSLRTDAVVHLPTLQSELVALNQQSRDRAVTPVLRGGAAPGTVDVELKVKDSLPVHGSLEVNDRYTANTTQTRVNVSASYDNLFQRFHSLSLQYQGSPEEFSQVRLLAATYTLPLTVHNHVLALYAVDTNSDFAAAGSGGGTLGILGTGRIYGSRLVLRLPSTPTASHSLTLGADYKDFVDSIALPGGTTDQTPIRYLGWTAGYGGQWLGADSDGMTSWRAQGNLSLNFGVRGLVNDPADFDYKRFNAKPNYLHLRADASLERPLALGSSVLLRATGQWTADPLISNEQFAIGGVDSVRGYLESAQLGDLGISGSLELRAPLPKRWLGEWANQFLLLAFYDAGVVRILDPLEDAEGNRTKRRSLSSAGAGLRLQTQFGLIWAFDWAYPLEDSDRTLRGDSRLHLRMRYEF